MAKPIPSLLTRLAAVCNIELDERAPNYNKARADELDLVIREIERVIENGATNPVTDAQIVTIVERVLAKRATSDRVWKALLVVTSVSFLLVTVYRNPFSRIEALETAIASKEEIVRVTEMARRLDEKVSLDALPNLANLKFIVDRESRIDFEPPGFNDGIYGAEDHCPNISGVKESQGCPDGSLLDADSDGVINLYDSCDTVADDKSKVLKTPASLDPTIYWVYQEQIAANPNLGCTINEHLIWDVLDANVDTTQPAGAKYTIEVDAAMISIGFTGKATCEVVNDENGLIASAECTQ